MTNNTFFSKLFIFTLIISISNCTSSSEDQSTQNNTTIKTNSNLLFIGTYTKKEGHVDGKAGGIYLYNMDPETGSLTFENVTKGVINPSFLTLSDDGKFLYTVNETGPEVDSVALISAFKFNQETKTLHLLNSQSSHSFAPCHISVDKQNRFAFAANYVGGKVVVLPIKKDGSLAPASDVIELVGQGNHPRQEASHPHSVILSPDERFAYVSDLGTDKIMIYKIDYKKGKLVPAEVPFTTVSAESGPRHLTFHPNEKFAYVINELNNTITIFSFNSETGTLTNLESISTLPEGFVDPSFTADIHITADGKYLYGSNRGHDSIVAFKIDANSGKLSLIEHESTQGEFPRNFMITNNGKYLYAANQNSDNIIIFKIETDGSLTAFDQIKVATPVCLKML